MSDRLREKDGPEERHRKEQARIRYRGLRQALIDRLDEKRITVVVWGTTYATARVQTLDHGQPVARTTVAGELGHGSNVLLDWVCARIAQHRPRNPYVEYRLPAVSLPGEAYFRQVLGFERVDQLLAEAAV